MIEPHSPHLVSDQHIDTIAVVMRRHHQQMYQDGLIRRQSCARFPGGSRLENMATSVINSRRNHTQSYTWYSTGAHYCGQQTGVRFGISHDSREHSKNSSMLMTERAAMYGIVVRSCARMSWQWNFKMLQLLCLSNSIVIVYIYSTHSSLTSSDVIKNTDRLTNMQLMAI